MTTSTDGRTTASSTSREGATRSASTSPEKNEPQIWSAIRFGSVVENVVVDPETRAGRLHGRRPHREHPRRLPARVHPRLRSRGPSRTCTHRRVPDGGRLRGAAARSRSSIGTPRCTTSSPGSPSKLAGTEAGLGSEPEATFSTCFGSPFLPLPPGEYARMLGEKIDKHDSEVFLVNTGWTGGPYGVGKRMSLPLTRAMVTAATSGRLRDVETTQAPDLQRRRPRFVPRGAGRGARPEVDMGRPSGLRREGARAGADVREELRAFRRRRRPRRYRRGPDRRISPGRR